MEYKNSKIKEVAELLMSVKRIAKDGKAVLRAPELGALFAEISSLPADQRAGFGQEVNKLRSELEKLVSDSQDGAKKLTAIDVTAPFDKNVEESMRPGLLTSAVGSRHPLMTELDTILDIFYRMGFIAVESRQIDDDYHMFSSLNFPEGHPARDDYDTFTTTDGLIAPAHTSTMQNRVLKTYKSNLEKGLPISAIIPGRVFRNEDLDARHEHTFYQLEGIYVDKGINVGNLIATLKTFLQEYYHKEIEVQTQPFYFPFTEPSFEFSLSCPFCDKKGCNICSYSGWIELLGCGLIHPNVLKEAGIDPNKYTGFAWGGGIDRLVMMKYDIEDVRHFEAAKIRIFEAVLMKISIEWMKKYGTQALDIPIEKLTEKIGSQLGAVEDTINLAERYKGILVAKIVECVQHPNADRLHVCKIDDGGKARSVERDEKGYVQVVCGAPNVETGLLVAWLPPGVTVPSSFGGPEPFVLEARDLRGQTSNGMLASPKELALGDSHEGILVIDEKAKPGEGFADVYKLDDYIIDIENKMFTHRPDCFGILGVAREIAGIQNISFTSPEWYKKPMAIKGSSKDYLPLEVKNDLPDLVPRFMAQVIKDVTIKPSPIWLQSYLSRVGVRAINNVVDVTNYMMLLTGQPLHAYDYDKVLNQDKNASRATLLVRRPKPEEKIDLLGGKQVGLNGQEILISSAEKAIGLGGVMGGSTTEVDYNTKNIILECAAFDMYTIRRTSMAHGLFTDAVSRFNKGQSPKQNDRVIIKASEMIIDLGGQSAKLASNLIDIKNFKDKDSEVKVTSAFVNHRLGLDLSPVAIQKLLQNVEFVVELDGDELSVIAPFWRTDIEIPEDIVEEIGRLYGYDYVPQVLPNRSIVPASENEIFNLKTSIRSILASGGANEVLTYTFVHGKLLQNVGQDRESAFELNNALSPELQYYRLSLTPSLLEKVYPNLRSDYVRNDDNEFALFEINKVSNRKDKDEEKLPREYQCLSFVFAADAKTATRKYQGAAYYAAKKYLSYLLVENRANTTIVPFSNVDKSDLLESEWVEQLVKSFDPDRSGLVIDELGKIRGIVGEFSASAKKALKLPSFCSGFEIDIELFKFVDELPRYIPVAKFPKVEQDLTLKVPAKVKYEELYEFIWQQLDEHKPENSAFSIRPLGIYQAAEDSDSKNISFRLWINAEDRTLTTDLVNKLLDEASKNAAKKMDAERV